MRTILRRLIIVLVVAIVATLVYSNRDRIGLLSNNNIKIQGDWYRVAFNFKEADVYTFADRLIDRNGYSWGAYRFLSNKRLEITTDGRVTTYEIEFPDDENMVWYARSKGELRPRVRWRR